MALVLLGLIVLVAILVVLALLRYGRRLSMLQSLGLSFLGPLFWILGVVVVAAFNFEGRCPSVSENPPNQLVPCGYVQYVREYYLLGWGGLGLILNFMAGTAIYLGVLLGLSVHNWRNRS